ncbi:DUF3592 domain-containing protein [Verrucomicrobiaceae bacterium R5-34]|uniref:DUF3592 domain-containing protein n=1 Tax=Oceaniferula flava TaxID=2800421 RepID=A0AAE2SC62_9BACT|nr:DUF3592 domain-containing protein [Oceaniferula flavus]MBK1830907.1 DUF3592 domain-containing protein [Verrucomicrobiaceae bacterium R5-34]MBK1855753.1 DUF3592 domain-containing protein [Oceaniferula flavus]MBM1137060.1 DUF3592 domain-containing protein [Oceaniferula flavus]
MNRSDGRAGRLFLCLIGLMLILVGGVFEWLMIRSYQHAKASREWPQVEALVLRSVIDERQINGSPREFRLNVLFGYSYQGEEFTSDRLSPRGTKWTKETEALEQLAEQYASGTTHTAWVNPEQPDAAIMVHDTKAAGYTLWFPALIIIGGGGMIWGAFKK